MMLCALAKCVSCCIRNHQYYACHTQANHPIRVSQPSGLYNVTYYNIVKAVCSQVGHIFFSTKSMFNGLLIIKSVMSALSIICADREWMLEDDVLDSLEPTLRSSLYDKAHQENERHIVEIKDFEPETVEAFVTWIYTQRKVGFLEAVSSTHGHVLQSSLAIHKLAHAFAVSQLKVIIEAHIAAYLRQTLESWLLIPDSNDWSTAFETDLAQAINEAYRNEADGYDEQKPLIRVFVDAVVERDFSTTRKPGFRRVLAQTPAFAIDILCQVDERVSELKSMILHPTRGHSFWEV
ncbi:hypothetical protein F5Y16DRAFT_148398 [Xylariaceae sp. FL0255]|nr:hypothetical protein F5Y16DRAFT_148398 [Xylariaceae sp. FL0255]